MSYTDLDPDTLARHAGERDRHFKRNYAIHALEGGLYMGGVAFVAPGTVLPTMMESLGAPSWLIALAPSLMLIGFMAPGVFVAPWVESLPRMHPMVNLLGGLQRLPYLAAALLLLFAADPGPWTLAVVVAAPLFSGLLGGVNVPVWQEFVARTVPENRRSSLWAIRFLIHAGIGVAAGFVVDATLGQSAGPREYGLLHLYLSAFIFVSFLLVIFAREAELPPRRAVAASPLELLRAIPGMLKTEKRFRDFLLTKVTFQLLFFVVPFMAIHAREVTGAREGFVGVLLSWQMGGMVAGNLLAGQLGDRKGGKAALMVGHLVLLGLCLWGPFMETRSHFIAMFTMFGFGISFTNVGGPTMDMEILPERRRVSAMAVIGWANLAGILGASIAAGWLRDAGYSYSLLSLLAASGLFVATLLLWRIPEPRNG